MREAKITERIYLIQIRHLNQLINILFLLGSDKMYLNFTVLVSYMQNLPIGVLFNVCEVVLKHKHLENK